MSLVILFFVLWLGFELVVGAWMVAVGCGWTVQRGHEVGLARPTRNHCDVGVPGHGVTEEITRESRLSAAALVEQSSLKVLLGVNGGVKGFRRFNFINN